MDSSYLLSIRLLISFEYDIHPVISETIPDTLSMLSTSWWFEFSTSFIAISISWIWLSSCFESLFILPTFFPVFVTFLYVSWTRFIVSSIEAVILSDVSWSLISASSIIPDDDCVSVLNELICCATTPKPLPASPALAASIEAFNASNVVCSVISSILPVSALTLSNSSLKFSRICPISDARSVIAWVVSTRLSRSVELVFACSVDSAVRLTICSIISATRSTCELMSVVISTDESVVFSSFVLLSVNVTIPSATTPALCVFSTEISLTTETPLIIELLAFLTFSTVVITRLRSAFILFVIAPSDSLRWCIDMT